MAPLLAHKGRTHHDQPTTILFRVSERSGLAGGSDGDGLAERVQQRGPSDNRIHGSGAGRNGYCATRGTSRASHGGSRGQANHGYHRGGETSGRERHAHQAGRSG
jgi:hypothetical protein